MNNSNGKPQRQKSNRRYKFNFVDLILILLCVAIIAGCAYIFSPNFKFDLFSKKEAVDLQYVVEIQGVDEEFIEKNLSPGGAADLLAATYFLYFLKQ